VSTIELRGFGWRHAGRRAHAVQQVDLTIGHGERVLLLGPSGAGKSTLLAAMAGLLPDDSGEQTGQVLVDGQDARQRRSRIGILFQDPQSQLVMERAGDDVAFGLENLAVAPHDIWPRVDKALSSVGFEYELDRSTNALSGGEQQRLALAGALAREPSLLLLDEPTANLDPAGADAVRDAVRRAVEGRDTTMVLVEHRVAEALPLVDRVVVLAAGGGIVADGTPRQVFTQHGEWLAAQGVWVPDIPLPQPRRGTPGRELLTASGLGLRHPGAARPALHNVDFVLREAELAAVLGANGSGKSTLALLLGGLAKPSEGTVHGSRVLHDGPRRPLHRWRATRLAAAIGSVFQNPEQQFVTSRVKDELLLGATSRDDRARKASELLERLRLSHVAEANPFTLSGGEARRLSVATALASAPRALIFDEPTFGQDRRTWLELVDLIAGLRDAGTAVAAVTHDEDFVAALADRTINLSGGTTC
jgi:energy-coupling factor transporter ATP-binding protein EcfA2